MQLRLILLFLGICIGIFGCNPVKKENVTLRVETYSIEDLEYPKKAVVIPDSRQKEFIENFFLPWNVSSEKLISSLDDFPGKALSYLDKYRNDDEWYGENKKSHTQKQRNEIVDAVDLKSFPNFVHKGIVTAHTNLRRIPSNKPGFDTYSKAGEGYPFDYFQETNLWANTPLQLLHLTNDGQWCYVASPIYKGWVRMHDIALVSEVFREAWSTGHYALSKSDSVSLQNTETHYAVNAKMGMVLPYEKMEDKNGKVVVHYVNSDEKQQAQLLKAQVEIGKLAFEDHAFDRNNLKHLVSQLEGRPYGWGGNLENRDCSSMIRDMMATFKIWLPRDSKDQIEIGTQYQLKGTLNEKMDFIKEKGIPFQTILRKKGHNMLYVGNNENGEPLIFHAIWGLKTIYSNPKMTEFTEMYPIEGIHRTEEGSLQGRHIIGEARITSVLVGEGNDGITTPLLEEMYAMTIIGR